MTNITVLPEFDNHEFVAFISEPRMHLRGFIVIHRRGPTGRALGATRLWKYDSELEALNDALRLSRLMSYKSALAGLKYGGGKAVLIASPEALKDRKALFRAFAEKVDMLGGNFVTGTDVGVSDADVSVMREETKYAIGNRVDPAFYTAVGVFYGIQASLERVFGKGKISGKSFAIQGVGKTGSQLVKLLYRDSHKLVVADVDPAATRKIKKQFPRTKVVPHEQIHTQEVDVFVPCALSGVLNPESVPELRCKVVAGSANNQLSGDHVGNLLMKLGILYAPDYVVNAGGLVSVVDEMEHRIPSEKRIMKRILNVKRVLRIIFDRSKKQGQATNLVANRVAEKIFNRQA